MLVCLKAARFRAAFFVGMEGVFFLQTLTG